MTIRHIFILIALLILIGLALAFVEPAKANTPETSLRYVCGDVIGIDAADSGLYTFVAYYPITYVSSPVVLTASMRAGTSRNFSVGAEIDLVHVFYEDTFLGMIEVAQDECAEDITYPPDTRANWQQGDSFFVAYTDDYGYLSVYSTITGELILHTNEPACSADNTACLYLLEDGSYQLNLIDPEGKLYEIGVQL